MRGRGQLLPFLTLLSYVTQYLQQVARVAILNVLFDKIKHWQPYFGPENIFWRFLPGDEIQMSGAVELNG